MWNCLLCGGNREGWGCLRTLPWQQGQTRPPATAARTPGRDERLQGQACPTSRLVPPQLCQALCSPAGQSQAAHLQVEAGVLHHPLCQCGNVDTSIALPCEEEIVLGVLREEPEEVLQCQVVVVSNLQRAGGTVRW